MALMDLAMKNKIKQSAIFIGILLLIALSYYTTSGDSVTTIRPLRGPAIQAVYATGTVEPTVMVPIAAKSTTKLISLHVDEGANVTKGQVLGQLENTELQNTLLEMQAALTLAEKEYERRQILLEKKATPQQLVDQAKSNLETARARVDQTKASIENMMLIAPESGTVIRRDGEIGSMISTNQTVFWLSTHQGLRISTEVDEEDISLVKVGQKVAITADAFKDKVFNGTVRAITPKGDPVSRSYRVRITLDDASGLMVGMTTEANIVVNENKNALLIPATAIKNNQVMVINGSKVMPTSIKTGARTTGVVEITGGITDQTVIVKDASTIKELSGSYRSSLGTWALPKNAAAR